MPSPLIAARFCLVAASLSLTLPGCSTQSMRIGADDGSDVCRQYRVALDSTGDYFGEDILKGAAIGAVGGGLLGLMAGGNARSALIGAAAGAAVGAAGGYFKARQQQAQDQATLYRTVSADIRRDNDYIDKGQLAFTQLTDCRQAEANRIKAAYRAGQMGRPQADALMVDVRRRANDDIRIAQAMNTKIASRSADFEFANNQVNPGYASSPQRQAAARPTARPAPAYAGPPGTPAEVQSATSTNVAKREQFNRAVATAQSRQQTAFELG